MPATAAQAHTLPQQQSWRVGRRLRTSLMVSDNITGRDIAAVPLNRYSGNTQHEADARLISAAPDLLEMTKLLERFLVYELKKDAGDDEGARLKTVTLNLCRAAIAKAKA